MESGGFAQKRSAVLFEVVATREKKRVPGTLKDDSCTVMAYAC